MSDPKHDATLTTKDVAHIVEAAGTHSLISASVLSSRVITEATGYFERSAAALEHILATLQGKGAHGAHQPMAVTATLDPASAKSIADTLSAMIQPQLDRHDSAIDSVQTRLGDLTRATAEGERMIASVLLGEEGHINRLERSIAEDRRIVASVLLGEEGHIRRHDLEIAALALRLTDVETRRGEAEASPSSGEPSSGPAEAENIRQAYEALRERVAAMEVSIRQLMANRRDDPGGAGGGSRQRRGT